MKVRSIGVKEVHCASPDATLTDIATMMRNYGVGSVPICEGDKLVGLVTDRDIAVACIANDRSGSTCVAHDYMAKPLHTISPDTDIKRAAKIMSDNQIRRLPVIERGKLVGMISLGDLALALKDDDKLVAETLRNISEIS